MYIISSRADVFRTLFGSTRKLKASTCVFLLLFYAPLLSVRSLNLFNTLFFYFFLPTSTPPCRTRSYFFMLKFKTLQLTCNNMSIASAAKLELLKIAKR